MGLRFSTGIGPIRYSTSLSPSRRGGGGGGLIAALVEMTVVMVKLTGYMMYYTLVWPIQKGAPVAIAAYQKAEIEKAGQKYWNRHPVATAVGALFAFSAIIAFWYVTIPALIIAGAYFFITGRRRVRAEEHARLAAAADASMYEPAPMAPVEMPTAPIAWTQPMTSPTPPPVDPSGISYQHPRRG